MNEGPPRYRRSARFVFGLLLLILFAPARTARASGLTSPEPLAKAYELVLDARYDEAEQAIRQACGPAPPTGCAVLEAVSQYWRLLSDPDNVTHDAATLATINSAVASGEAWIGREPKRGEAWFYLGGAYGTRVLLKGMLRNELLSAAHDGRRIHDALQQAVNLDPTLQDAYFGLGLYHYYAAIAPAAARVLRFLLLLPAGDRAGGLREMQQTQRSGMILRGEADYQLHLIYLWYEHRPADALKLIEGLRERYPHNPLFAQRAAIIQSDYQHASQAALQTYQQLLDSARAGRVADASLAEVSARLGIAQQMDQLCDALHAIDQLQAVIALHPTAPYSSLARAYYQLGIVFDRNARRGEAMEAYRHAVNAVPRDDRLQLAAKVRDRMSHPPITRACR